jgi:hypothetical protein
MKKYLTLFVSVISIASASFTVASTDNRQLVELPKMMQQHMRSNMRDHLTAINEILISLSTGELDKAADIAEFRLGMSSLDTHGASQMAKVMPAGIECNENNPT